MPAMALPEGDEKAEAVRAMFDAIAPRYDLVNRIMTFRMDVGWRRRTVAAARPCGPGSLVLDLACGTGDLCRELPTPRPLPRSASTCRSGCWPRPAPTAPLRPGRRPAPARRRRRRSTASPAGSPCATWWRSTPFFAELARVVRPGGRIALLEVAEPPNPVLRWGHGIYFGKVVPLHRRAAVRPRRLPLPAQLGRLPARARRDAGDARGAPGSSTSSAALLSAGIAQLLTAHPSGVT